MADEDAAAAAPPPTAAAPTLPPPGGIPLVKKVQPGSQSQLTKTKINSFQMGKQQKSRFQRAKEAAEAKKRQQDAEAASIYDSFVASFAGGEDDAGPAFVREGEMLPSSSHDKKKPLSEMEKMLVEMKVKHGSKEPVKAPELPAVPPPPPKDAFQGKRDMDAFLEEIKDRQDRQESHMPYPGQKEPAAKVEGSFDDGDPTTTNLYVGNLNPATTEERIRQVFGEFGSLLSIKIMWPRSDEERRKGRNCGFVSYWRRKDAQVALDALNDADLDGHTIMVRWGKAVSKLALSGQTLEPPPAADGRPVADLGMTPFDERIQVIVPRNPDQLERIDRMASYVAKYGMAFEEEIKRRERDNPDFDFIFSGGGNTEEKNYYRWRTLSLAMGDDEHRWRQEPYQFTQGGPYWVPPAYNSKPVMSDDDDEEGSRRGQGRQRAKRRRRSNTDFGGRLREDDEGRFRSMLGQLTRASRSQVAEAMCFALENADSSGHIVSILKEFLVGAPQQQQQCPPAAIMARLYLASDVLHNSSAPVKNASSFRTHLQDCLPEVFDKLGAVLRGIEGRMSAHQFQDRVLGLLAVWDRWSLFPPLYMSGLEAAFLRSADDAVLNEDEAKEDEIGDAEKLALIKRAKQAGLHTAGLSARQVLARLSQLNEFVKRKAKSVGLPVLEGVAALGTSSGVEAPVMESAILASADRKEDEDMDDVDGIPLDEGSDDDIDGVPILQGGGKDEDDGDIDGEPLS